MTMLCHKGYADSPVFEKAWDKAANRFGRDRASEITGEWLDRVHSLECAAENIIEHREQREKVED